MIRNRTFMILFITVGLCLFYGPTRAEALSKEISGLIASEQYNKASERLKELEKSPELLFAQGLIAFRRYNYDRADRIFRNLVRKYPDSSRSIDAEYFLDQIKIKSGTLHPPLIDVKLVSNKKISGTLTGSGSVDIGGINEPIPINAGEEWIVTRLNGRKLRFEISDRSIKKSTEGIVIIRPTRNSTKLAVNQTRYRGKFVFQAEASQQVVLVNSLPVDKYLYGVIRKEIAPDWPMPSVKAQAVAARSFVLSNKRSKRNDFDVESTHISQVYGGYDAETKRVRKAVRQTQGQVITYDNRVVPTYFHANSGGHIESAGNVWDQSSSPHIIPKPDTWSQNTRHSTWETSLRADEIATALTENEFPDPSSSMDIRIESTLNSGRTRTLSYSTREGDRATIRANEFRMALDPEKVKSSWYEVFESTNNGLTIKGRGWGHGVGLSQWGAKAMSHAGKTYREILSFYYGDGRLMDRYGLGTSRPLEKKSQ